MPASERSIGITDAYRARITRLGELAARLPWTVSLQDIDETGGAWIARTAAQLTVLQGAGAQLAAGYVAAYVASETGRPLAPRPVDDSGAGNADDGRPLTVALATALIAVKAALKRDHEPGDALRFGEDRARRMVASAAAAAPRVALTSAIVADEQIVGWRRVTRGGCGACLAAADNAVRQGELKVHPHCECTTEPVLAGVRDTVLRPSATKSSPHGHRSARTRCSARRRRH